MQTTAYKSFVDIAIEQAERRGDHTVYRILKDGENESSILNFSQLDKEARKIAAGLQSRCQQGDRIMLLFPTGTEFIIAYFGCLYAGCIAVTMPVPQPNQPLTGVQYIFHDSGAKLALTNQDMLSVLATRFENDPFLNGLSLLSLQELISETNLAWEKPIITPETVFSIQYTSGSVSAPKGVMISHQNLLAHEQMMIELFQLINPEDVRYVSWLPFYHGLGLIISILFPVYAGCSSIIMPPQAFLEKPVRWLQAISKYKGNYTGAPNFALDLCVKRITAAQRAELDLSSLKVLFVGAEPINVQTLYRFNEYFAPAGFEWEMFNPSYGMSEATMVISAHHELTSPQIARIDEEELSHNHAQLLPLDEDTDHSHLVVGCGKVHPINKMIIVDPHTSTQLPEEMVGEIWVKGPTVSLGYWHNDKETHDHFDAYLSDSEEGPFLRTGDLGFLKDHEIFITGRLKEMIIVRGVNHYPNDIEHHITLADPSISQNRNNVFAVNIENEEKIIVIQEINESLLKRCEELVTNICNAVTDAHKISVHTILFMKEGGLPTTLSGKISRHQVKSAYLSNNLQPLYRWEQGQAIASVSAPSETEQKPVSQNRGDFITNWMHQRLALHMKLDPQQVSTSKQFALLGVDSLLMASIAGELREEFRLPELTLTMFAEHPTIERFGHFLATLEGSGGAQKQEIVTETFPLSYLVPTLDEFPNYQKFQQLTGIYHLSGLNMDRFELVNDGVSRDTTLIDGKQYLNFCSYNYLGMSGDPYVSEKTIESIRQYGTSASASRLTSGEKPIHVNLEKAIADFIGTEDSLVFSAGHPTNVYTISHLFQNTDNSKNLILLDEEDHNRIFQGAIFSGANFLLFKHNDWEHLDSLLQVNRSKYDRALIVLEGVYSMSGDIPNLPAFLEIKRKYGAWMMIDEAHSIGTIGQTGRGISEHHHTNPHEVEIWMGTLSKAFGSVGGYIAASQKLISFLKFTIPGFIFSAAISPPNAAAALAAIELMKNEPERVATLQSRAARFLGKLKAAGLNTGTSGNSPVIPVIVGDPGKAALLSQRLFAEGIYVMPLIYPAVPQEKSLLRFFICSTHTEEEIDWAADTIIKQYKLVRGS